MTNIYLIYKIGYIEPKWGFEETDDDKAIAHSQLLITQAFEGKLEDYELKIMDKENLAVIKTLKLS